MVFPGLVVGSSVFPLISSFRRCGWSTTAHADPTGQDPHVIRGGHQGDGAAIPRLEGGQCAMMDERLELETGWRWWSHSILGFKWFDIWSTFELPRTAEPGNPEIIWNDYFVIFRLQRTDLTVLVVLYSTVDFCFGPSHLLNLEFWLWGTWQAEW